MRWDLPAHVVERRIRAVTPNPGAWTMVGDLRVKLGPVTVDETARRVGARRIRVERTVCASAPARSPSCSALQPPGKKPMNAADWARGARLDESARRPNDQAPQTNARQRRKPLDPARRAAFDVLRAVSERDAYANLALPALLTRTRNHRPRRRVRDRTDLRHLPHPRTARRDHQRRRRSSAGRIDPVLLDLLRLGTYQLLRTRVEPHAAVSTTVEQAGIEFDSGRAGFVNGVLRTIARRDEQSWVDGAGAAGRQRPRRPRGVRARASALDRAGVRRRARRAGRPAGRAAGQRRRTPVGAPRRTARRAHGRRAGRTGRRHGRPVFAVRRLPARRRSGPTRGRSATAPRWCRTRAASWWPGR